MRLKFIAMFFVLLLINVSFTYADFDPIESVEAGLENTADALSTFEATDIIVNVDSYHPTVLSEQAFESDQVGGYPVFATLTGLKTNPLMDLQRIASMRVRPTGGTTKYVKSISYKKPRGGYFDINNLGYMIIRLKNLKEDDVPKRLDINMTADIIFEIQNGFGINENDLVLPILSEEEFLDRKSEFSFWSGRGYVRLANVRNNYADLIVYDGRLNKKSFSVKEGDTSGKKFLTGGIPYLLRNDEDLIGRNYRNAYRVEVNQVTGNKDKAKFEMFINGEFKLKEFVEGQRLYKQSEWIVRDIRHTENQDIVEFVNEETREKLVLRGGKFYIPSEEETEAKVRYEFSRDVDYGDLIIKYAQKYKVDPELVAGVIDKESSFNFKSIGADGEAGLMQLMPLTAYSLGLRNIYAYGFIRSSEELYKNNRILRDSKRRIYVEDLKEEISRKNDNELKEIDDRFDPEKNIAAGVRYIKTQLNEFNNDEGLAIAAYNAGPAYVKNTCGSKSYTLCSKDLSNKEHVDAVLKFQRNYENKLIKISGEEPVEDKDKRLDTILNGKYKIIKNGLNELIKTEPRSKETVQETLNKYESFLAEVNGGGSLKLYNKYIGFILNDLSKLEERYRELEENEIANLIQIFVTTGLNVYSGPVRDSEDINYVEETPEYYFEKAIEEYGEVVNDYSDTSYEDRNLAMDAQEKIAKTYDYNLKRYEEAIEEYRKLISLYDYHSPGAVENRIQFLEVRQNYKSDTKHIFEGVNSISLTLYGVKEADKDSKAIININGQSNTFSFDGEKHKLGSTGWYLKEINNDNVLIGKINDKEREITDYLRLGRREVVDGYVFILEDVEIDQEVHLTILPGEEKLTTQSNFMLHVPVEPRLWKLSTEQMNQQINGTKKVIEGINKAISVIENVYRIWSYSCYATFGVLWIKNAILGNIGGSLARRDVMPAWEKECKSDVTKGTYSDVYECIRERKDEIKKDVSAVEGVLSNDNLNDFQKNEKLAGLETLNNKELKLEYDKAYLNDKFVNQISEKVRKECEGKEDPTGCVELEFNKEYKDFLSDVERETFVDENIYKEFYDRFNNSYLRKSVTRITEGIGSLIPQKNIRNGRYYAFEGDAGYPIFLDKDGDNTFERYEGDVNIDEKYTYLNEKGESVLITIVENTRETEVKHQPMVSLISSGKWKGKVDSLSVDSRTYIKVPEEGGRGSDGRILNVEFWLRDSTFGSKDNLPLTTGEGYRLKGPFHIDNCLKGSTSERKGVDVLESLRIEDKKQYDALKKACDNLMEIDSKRELKDKKTGDNIGNYLVEVAKQETGGLECFDIMGVDDCLTLFSVCDPVMCPVSRFTAGGKWHVDNVVSSGIVGSILLGSKLWDFGRTPPEVGLCIPGINAGLKNYRSLTEGYQQCLIARRDKGENVGICDTIRSIGWCKIAWREGLSVVKLGGGVADSILNRVLGRGVGAQGGGEYAFFQTNLDRSADFFNFFTKEYATTYFSAYRGSSTDEIGEELCKAAIYGKIPGRGNFLDQLTKPEGPVQFTGWFTEVPHSDIGGDLYSDYEVYYHIYAGEDRDRVRYYVYLKDLDDLSRRLYVTKTTGYLARGDFVDETWRETTVTGYDELCIVVENQEHCGFGRVSSDLLLDYLEDKSIAKSAENKNIKSEQECIGESTVLTQPGIGNLVDAFYPGSVKNGLVRVCSNQNPGKGVAEADWETVGTCGNNSAGQNLGECWLSKQSYLDSLSEYDTQRRKEAEDFFKKLGVSSNFKSDEAVMKIIQNLIDDRNTLTKSVTLQYEVDDTEAEIKEYEEEVKNEFIDIINQFVDIEDDTANLNLMSKINYEVGETYYELAVYLNKEKVKETPSETEIDDDTTPVVDGKTPSGIAPRGVSENNLKYKVELVNGGFLNMFPNGWFRWDSSFWYEEEDGDSGNLVAGVFKSLGNRIGIKSWKKLLSSEGGFEEADYEEGLNEIKLNVFDYLKEVNLYCENENNDKEYNLKNLDKDTENIKMNKVVNWVKLTAQNCIPVGGLERERGESKTGCCNTNQLQTGLLAKRECVRDYRDLSKCEEAGYSWIEGGVCNSVTGICEVPQEPVEEKKECSDCGKGITNICDKEECEDLGECTFIEAENFWNTNQCIPSRDLEGIPDAEDLYSYSDEDPGEIELPGGVPDESYSDESYSEEIPLDGFEERIQERLDSLRSGEVPYDNWYGVGALCGMGVNIVLDYIFGVGTSCDLEILNVVAWKYRETIQNLGGEVVNVRDIDFDTLPAGSILGYYYDESDYLTLALEEGAGYTHIAVYLGQGKLIHKYPHSIRKDNVVGINSLEKFREDDTGGKFRLVEALVPPFDILNRERRYDTVTVRVEEHIEFTLREFGVYPSHCSIYLSEIREINDFGRKEVTSSLKGEIVEIPLVGMCGSHMRVFDEKVISEISKSIKYRVPHLDENKADEWGEAIVRTMVKHNLPIKEDYLSLVVSTIERESLFMEDPISPDFKKMYDREVEKRNIPKWVADAYYDLNRETFDGIETERDYEMALDKFLVDPFGIAERFVLPKVSTVGSMQLNVNNAIALAKEYYNKDYSNDEMREILYTLEGGVDYGILYLSEIINAYTDFGTKPLSNYINVIAADYQSGLYASRNAALQKQLNALMGTNLNLDGDIGPKTIEVVNKFIESKGHASNLNEDSYWVSIQDTKDFEDFSPYRLIKEEYAKRFSAPEYAVIPGNVIDSSKFGIEITSRGYVRGTYSRYVAYCKLLDCD